MNTTNTTTKIDRLIDRNTYKAMPKDRRKCAVCHGTGRPNELSAYYGAKDCANCAGIGTRAAEDLLRQRDRKFATELIEWFDMDFAFLMCVVEIVAAHRDGREPNGDHIGRLPSDWVEITTDHALEHGVDLAAVVARYVEATK